MYTQVAVKIDIIPKISSGTSQEPTRQYVGKLSFFSNYILFESRMFKFSILRIYLIDYFISNQEKGARVIHIDCVDNNNIPYTVFFGPGGILDGSMNWTITVQNLYQDLIRWKRTNDYTNAKSLEDLTQYEDAYKIYFSLSKSNDCLRVKIKQARSLEEQKRFDDALSIYKNLSMKEDITRVLVLKAIDAADKKDFDLAIMIFNKLGLPNEQKRITLMKADFQEQEQKFDEALEIYKKLGMKDQVERILLIKEKIFEEAYGLS